MSLQGDRDAFVRALDELLAKDCSSRDRSNLLRDLDGMIEVARGAKDANYLDGYNAGVVEAQTELVEALQAIRPKDGETTEATLERAVKELDDYDV